MDATERELFAASLRHATESGSGAALDAALDELGWADALVADPHAAVSLLFEQQGAANATSSALDRVLLDALALDPTLAKAAFVLPALGRCDPPGTLIGETLAIRGLAAASLGDRDVAVVVASAASGTGPPAIVPVETKNLTLRTVRGFDPALALVEVTAEAIPAAPVSVAAPALAASAQPGMAPAAPPASASAPAGQAGPAVVSTSASASAPAGQADPAVVSASASASAPAGLAVPPVVPTADTVSAEAVADTAHAAGVLVGTGWSNAVAAGQRAVGHELVGAGRAMLRLAREHALDRVQFGRPIGSFQAIRHRLADTLVAIEAADAALQAAWDDPSPVNAALAKALASRAALTAARHCQQVLAGIGFTVEHPLHRHVRRARVLDQLIGSARTLTRQLGEDLLATHRLPALLPL